MMMRNRWLTLVAGGAGFFGVALGAFGAHGLEGILESNGRTDTWETAVLYHLVHAVALLAVALGPASPPPRVVAVSFLIGMVVFSGSLYLLALTNQTWLGAITPIGGVAFLVGWAALVFGKQPAGK